jgi:hypothetical protein
MTLLPMPKNVRASDRLDLGHQEEDGFVVRKRFPSVRKMAQLCLSGLIIVLGVTVLLRNDTLIGSLICISVGSVMLYLGRTLEKQQNVINATEFMNAVFSSALCKGYRFCFIARANGNIIYLDRGFQELFPDFMSQSERELSVFCETQQLRPDVAAKLTELVRTHAEASLEMTALIGSNRVVQILTITCEPITRPKGYVLVRGK